MDRRIIAAVIAGSLSLSACTDKPAEQLLQEANAARDAGQVKQAEILIKQAISAEPKSEFRLALAELYLQQGNVEGAGKELASLDAERLTQAQLLLAEQLNAHVALLNYDSNYTRLFAQATPCDLCTATEQWASLRSGQSLSQARIDALPASSLLIQAFINDSMQEISLTELASDVVYSAEWLLIADLMIGKRQMQNAATAYQNYADIHPNTRQINLPYAQALINLGDYEAADKLISQVLGQYDKNPVANYLKSVILMAQNNNKEALKYISLADAYGINLPSATLTKGFLEFDAQNYESALGSFQKTIQLDSDNELAKAMLTATKVRLGIDDGVLQQLAATPRYSEVELATLGQMLGKTPDSMYWQQIEQNLAQQPSSTATVLRGLIELMQKGESDILAQQGDNNDDTYNLIQMSMMINQGKYGEALDYTKSWLERTEDKAQVLNYKGSIEVAMGDRDAAAKTFAQALAINPANRASHLFLSQQAAMNKDYNAAVNAIDAILQNNVLDITALKLFVAYERLTRSAEHQNKLMSYLNRAIEQAEQKVPYQLLKAGYLQVNNNPKLAQDVINQVDKDVAQTFNQYWEIRFLLATNANDVAAAESIYKDWQRLNPNAVHPAYAISGFYKQRGMLDKAIERLTRHPVIARGDDLAGEVEVITLNIQKGDTNEAARRINKLSASNTLPEAIEGYLRGFLAFRTNNLTESIKQLESAYAASPTAHTLRLLYLVNQAQGNDLTPRLEAHLATKPGDNLIRILLAESYIGKDNNKAETLLKQLVDVGVNTAQVNNNLAWVYYLKQQYQQGLPYAQAAIEAEPANADYLDTTLRLLTSLKQFEQVVDLAERASTSSTHLLVANAYYQLGERAKAADVLANVDEKTLGNDDRAIYVQIQQG